MAQTETATKTPKGASPLLTLSTEIKSPNTIDVDGKLYKVLSGEHLGRAEEAQLMALFREHDRHQLRLQRSKRRDEAEKAAGNMRDVRVEIITSLTDLPEKMVAGFGMSTQAQLMEICAKEMGFGDNRQLAGDGEWDDDDLDVDES